MSLQVVVYALKERSIAEGSHCDQEISISHSELAVLLLDRSEDFVRFFRWREETDFVFVVASNDFCSVWFFTLRVVIIGLLLHVECERDGCEQHHGDSLLTLARGLLLLLLSLILLIVVIS